MSERRAFLVFGAELPWVFPLADALAGYGPTLGIRIGVKPPTGAGWPFERTHENFKAEVWTYPRGFNRTFSSWFDRWIRSRVNRAVTSLRDQSGTSPYVIVPDPSLLAYVTDVEPGKLVYLNYDDYTVETVRGSVEMPGETALAMQAGSVTCSSLAQTKRFKERFRTKQDTVFHLPHGVHESFVNQAVSKYPAQKTVCCVGYLTARYDWELIYDVVSAMPSVTFSFIGEGPTDRMSGVSWREALDATLAKPNVRHIRGLRHRETAVHYWQSSVNWMPYDAAVPFVQACCPLKLTDGLASGRPVVSADVPECALYPDWITIHRSAGEAQSAIGRALEQTFTETERARSEAQVAFAKENTWERRAVSFVDIVERHTCTS